MIYCITSRSYWNNTPISYNLAKLSCHFAASYDKKVGDNSGIGQVWDFGYDFIGCSGFMYVLDDETGVDNKVQPSAQGTVKRRGSELG